MLMFAALCIVVGFGLMMLLAEGGVQLWYQWSLVVGPGPWTLVNGGWARPPVPAFSKAMEMYTFAWPFGWGAMQLFHDGSGPAFSPFIRGSILPGRPWRQSQLPLWMVLLMTSLVPWTFLILRQSRRVAKVRNVHLVRSACYSLAWLPLAAVAFAVGAAFVGIGQTSIYGFVPPRGVVGWLMSFSRASWALVPLVTVWTAVYWSVVAGRYLRLRHAAAVGVAMTLIAGLSATAILLAIPSTDAWVEVGDFLDRVS